MVDGLINGIENNNFRKIYGSLLLLYENEKDSTLKLTVKIYFYFIYIFFLYFYYSEWF